jgi:hypothetical protein
LEILGDFSSCRAKIPDGWPWRVQVQGQAEPMEVLVRRESTMAELLEQLKLSESTHEVVFLLKIGCFLGENLGNI